MTSQIFFTKQFYFCVIVRGWYCWGQVFPWHFRTQRRQHCLIFMPVWNIQNIAATLRENDYERREKNRKRLLSSDEKLFNLFCFTVLSVFNEVKVSLVYHCVTYKSMYGRTTNSSHQAISRRSSYFQQTALHVLQVAGTKYVAEIKVPKPNWVFATCWDILFLQKSSSFHKANCCHGFFSLPITVVRVQVCFGIKLFNY